MTDKADLSRRHFLTAATAVTGGVGLMAATVPIISIISCAASTRMTLHSAVPTIYG
jgi:Rieske Fe-S protein